MKKFTFLILMFLFMVINSSVYAQLTYVPDDNFEQALIDLGYDDVLDDYVLTSSINAVTILNVDELLISDLTGIKDFSLLEELYCRDNNIFEINVDGLINLQELHCSNNTITSLIVGQNNVLYKLRCSNNLLTNLDISQNPNLYQLDVNHNNLQSINLSNNVNLDRLSLNANLLTEIDLSNNIMLDHLNILGNQLTALNLTNNINLSSIECQFNQLESLDLSSNISLVNIWCYANQLSFLDIRNGMNTNIGWFNSEFNVELDCIFVDDAIYSTDHWEHVGENSSFVETQEDCDNILSNSSLDLNNNSSIYPNPVNNILNIKTNGQNIKTVKIINLQGIIVKEVEVTNRIDVSSLASGMYFISVSYEGATFTKKFIKL